MRLIDFLKVHKEELQKNELLKLYYILNEMNSKEDLTHTDLNAPSLTRFLQSKNINVLEYTEGIVPSLCFDEFDLPKEFILPKGITKIERYAFSFVDGMQKFYAAPGLKEIDIAAFYECNDLAHVYLPDTVTYIADGEFTDPKNKIIIHCQSFTGYPWKYAEQHRITRDNLYRYPKGIVI